jgi:hypothetical protein
MNPRYRPIRVKKPFCIRDHEHTVMCQGGKFWEEDAIECVGTGLAIQRVWYQPLLWEGYAIVHIASGTLLLQNTVPTLVQAGMWLRKVKGLCDWTQPAHSLQIQPDTREQIYFAWLDTLFDFYLFATGKKPLSQHYWDYVESDTGQE